MSVNETRKFYPIAAILLLTLVSLSLSVGRTYAQTLSGSIVGSVTDTSQVAIPDATVTIRDPATNQTRTTGTNDSGACSFLAIPPADYEVKVTKEGFRPV